MNLYNDVIYAYSPMRTNDMRGITLFKNTFKLDTNNLERRSEDDPLFKEFFLRQGATGDGWNVTNLDDAKKQIGITLKDMEAQLRTAVNIIATKRIIFEKIKMLNDDISRGQNWKIKIFELYNKIFKISMNGEEINIDEISLYNFNGESTEIMLKYPLIHLVGLCDTGEVIGESENTNIIFDENIPVISFNWNENNVQIGGCRKYFINYLYHI